MKDRPKPDDAFDADVYDRSSRHERIDNLTCKLRLVQQNGTPKAAIKCSEPLVVTADFLVLVNHRMLDWSNNGERPEKQLLSTLPDIIEDMVQQALREEEIYFADEVDEDDIEDSAEYMRFNPDGSQSEDGKLYVSEHNFETLDHTTN